MISINGLEAGFGARTLFAGATFVLNSGARYGVVGANGSGKSTFVRMLSGQEEIVRGSISIPKTARVGVLKQDHFQYEDVRILDVVMMGNAELWDAMAEKEQMLAAAETAPESFDVNRFGELEDFIMQLDGYALESRAAEVLEGLNIPSEVHRQPLSTLSGGYKLRVLLAQTLASHPDVLLLDEPTNHLDIVSIAWLEKFLLGYEGCAVIVSHDHRFLNTVSTHILDVDYQLITQYVGNYDAFEAAKVEDRERKEREISKREAEIEHHKQFVERFRYKATKARQAQSKLKQMEKIDIEALPASSRSYPNFKFEARRQTGKDVVRVDQVCKSFGDNDVLFDVSFTVQRGERVAVIGPNGIGKSTLLKIMIGELEADLGEVEWGHEAEPGYFSQSLDEVKSAASTSVHDWLWNFCSDQTTGFVRGKLAAVLFGREDIDKKIAALSGGESARLAFARLGILAPTVLVLDEPTNHLDLEGIEALANGLKEYPNAIIFVSHDRWFVSQLATRVLEISAEGVEDFGGTYDEFVEWSSAARDHLDHEAVIDSERRKRRKEKHGQDSAEDAPPTNQPPKKSGKKKPKSKPKYDPEALAEAEADTATDESSDPPGVKIRKRDDGGRRKKGRRRNK